MGDLAHDYYERFWADADYNLQYAWDSARRARQPALLPKELVWRFGLQTLRMELQKHLKANKLLIVR